MENRILCEKCKYYFKGLILGDICQYQSEIVYEISPITGKKQILAYVDASCWDVNKNLDCKHFEKKLNILQKFMKWLKK